MQKTQIAKPPKITARKPKTEMTVQKTMVFAQNQIPKTLTNSKAVKTIGLISDTHIPSRAKAIPPTVFRVFAKVDFIIHAGDIVELSVIDELEQIAPVLAVQGNMDDPKVRGVFPEVNSLKVADWKIGVTHDQGEFSGLGKMRELARQNLFDVVVFGHTHTSKVRWEGKTLFINPGSPTNPQPPFLCKPTVGLLKIATAAIIPEIVEV
jgi:putative phosphoesterase